MVNAKRVFWTDTERKLVVDAVVKHYLDSGELPPTSRSFWEKLQRDLGFSEERMRSPNVNFVTEFRKEAAEGAAEELEARKRYTEEQEVVKMQVQRRIEAAVNRPRSVEECTIDLARAIAAQMRSEFEAQQQKFVDDRVQSALARMFGDSAIKDEPRSIAAPPAPLKVVSISNGVKPLTQPKYTVLVVGLKPGNQVEAVRALATTEMRIRFEQQCNSGTIEQALRADFVIGTRFMDSAPGKALKKAVESNGGTFMYAAHGVGSVKNALANYVAQNMSQKAHG